MTERKLTAKQAAFVQEYLIDLNATAAARRAGYSAKTADPQGPRLLGNVRVSAAIEAAQAARAERTGITQDWVLAGIKAEAEAVRAGTADPNPQAALKAFELAGRHLQMFTDKLDLSGSVSIDRKTYAIPAEEQPQPPKANGHANGNGASHD